MKRLFTYACLLLAPAAYADKGAPDSEEILRVMLQGESAPLMRQLVTDNGGEVTHDLHIINAVGAILNRAQMNAILESGLVERHIDDLSLSAEPPEEEPKEKSCQVAGSLELAWGGSSIRWKLFNKDEEKPAALQGLSMSWPEKLGTLTEVRLAGKKITGNATGTSLDIEFPPDALPEFTGVDNLEVSFSRPMEGALQSDFDIIANFGEDCESELIPGYANNHENFYYATAAGADLLHLNGVTGRGVTVAVLDSGLWEHPALQLDTHGENRVLARFDAIENVDGEEVFDESGHGTHMTSVMAHSEPVTEDGEPLGWFKGIAPDMNIVAVKAFDEEGQGDFLDIVRGVQYVVDNREEHDIRVLNLSFAARPRWPYWDDPINQAIMRAWDAGITVVAAAGNEGPEPMTIGSPGNLPYIITVGAVTDSWTLDTRDDDYIPDFSSQGPTPSAHIKPDIVALGGHISGVTRPGSTLTQQHPEYLLSTGEFVMTGTSQAAALVSGIVALLVQMEPGLSPDDIKCKLITSAEPAINLDGLLAYSPFQQGHGYVTAPRAVALGATGCGNSEMELKADIAGEDHYQGPANIDDEGQVSLPGLSKMLSPIEPEKGLSSTRKWGAKEHLERENGSPSNELDAANNGLDWISIYLNEMEIMRNLSATPDKQ